MVRRYLTLAAMLLVMASLMVGVVGTASAQDPVHEADGTWHKSDDGTVRFNVTWKGFTNIRWSNRVGMVERELGEGQVEEVSASDWLITVTSSAGSKREKARSKRHARFTNLAIGLDHDAVIQGRNSGGAAQGDPREFTIRSRHISPLQPVTGLALEVGDDNLIVEADWTAPATGGKPKRYVVIITNLETGRVIGQWLNVTTRGKKQVLPAGAAFDGLWPGDNYRVSVQTLTYDSRASSRDASKLPITNAAGEHTGKEAFVITEGWQGWAWTSATITLPSGNVPGYDKTVPALIWTPVAAGEAAPPYVIGEPTAYIIGSNAPGGYSKFDAPGECLNYRAPHLFIINGDRAAYNAVKAARNQEVYRLAPAQQALQYARDNGASAAVIARRQAEVDAAQGILDGMVAKVGTECARAYPAVESLTQADQRWYRTAERREWRESPSEHGLRPKSRD